jgi:Fur family transcriptional regulator, ferric uptake regulator
MSGREHHAEQLILNAGERATASRVRVFAYLLEQDNAVPHVQIESELGEPKIDRVTLYRVLDWLAEKNFVHRLAGDDRIWRFMVNDVEMASHHHAHFKCVRCDKVTCLEDVSVSVQTPSLPAGYRPIENELMVKGICPNCN